MPLEMSALFWAPASDTFVCVNPDFPAGEYGFTRHPVHLTRWFCKDPMKALRALLDERFKMVSQVAREKLQPLWASFQESYSALPEPLDDIPPAPAGREYKQYQIAGIQTMVHWLRGASRENPKGVLLADEMGLGKTIQAIGVFNALRARRALVICPASLRINWEREIKAWSVQHNDVHHATFALHYKPASWIIVSYDMSIRKDIRERIMDDAFDLVILDEAHYIKTPKSRRTNAAIGRTAGRSPAKGFISRANRTLLLTGTPVPNRPVEAWSYVWPFVLDQFPVRAKGQWDAFYGTWEQAKFGRKYSGAKNVADMNVRLRCGFMLRRMKSQVMAELPPIQHKMITLAPGGFKEILKEERQFSVEEIIAHAVPKGSALSSLRRIMGIAKAPHAVMYIKSILEEVDKVVVFAHHKEVMDYLSLELEEFSPVSVRGETPQAQRQRAVDRFQADPACRVFLGNIEAAGVGLTLTASSDVVFAEHSWVPEQNAQAAARCHRIGQRGCVVVHDLVVEGSLDGKILLAGAKKTAEIEALLS